MPCLFPSDTRTQLLAGTQRNADKARRDVLGNECFVCGFRRQVYDEVAPISGPSFDEHKDRDHDVWKYVYFLHHLRSRDPGDHTGAEAFVSRMLAAEDLSWFPTRTSLAIQSSAATTAAAFSS